jgi:hypothetical protein
MSKSKKKDPPKPKTLKRKVFVYRINAGIDPATHLPRVINFHPALSLDT